MGHDYARLSVVKTDGDDFSLTLVTCKDAEQGGGEIVTEVARIPASRVYEAGLHPNYELNIWLRVKVAEGGKCTFSYSLDGRKYKNVSGDFQARQGKWIGAKVGIFSITPAGTDRGWIDVDSFDVCK